MATYETDIESALNQQLNAMVGLPDVAWPNYEYEPEHGTSWLRPTLLPANTVANTTTSDRHTGIYQVDVFTEAGKGSSAGKALVDLVADQFKPGTQLTYNGTVVEVLTVGAVGARTEGAWYHIPVEVRYISQTPNR